MMHIHDSEADWLKAEMFGAITIKLCIFFCFVLFFTGHLELLLVISLVSD